MKYLGRDIESFDYANIKGSVIRRCSYGDTHFCDGSPNLTVKKDLNAREPCRLFHNGCPVHKYVVLGEGDEK